MDELTNQIRNIILKQLSQDGLNANAYVHSYSGSLSKIEIIKLELLFFNQLSVLIQVSKNSKDEICLHLINLNGILDTDDLMKISNSLNNTKSHLTHQF